MGPELPPHNMDGAHSRVCTFLAMVRPLHSVDARLIASVRPFALIG